MSDSTASLDFWAHWHKVNTHQAIYHQWEELERSGCIDNFRIAAKQKDAFRLGWFFADSDAYKWLEAAVLIQARQPDPKLAALIDQFIQLIGAVQEPDGYLFTYNQIHFPGTRWVSLQIEHELYCHGHLIEAGVSHYEVSGKHELLNIAIQAANCITADFLGKSAHCTPGHEEIEIALLRLYKAVGNASYLRMAEQLIHQRGRIPLFAREILTQNASTEKRAQQVRSQRQAYEQAHAPIVKSIPPGNKAPKPWNSKLRWYAAALSGKLLQQAKPVTRMTKPEGHAVRFGYLETAFTQWMALSGDTTALPIVENAWQRMVERRMYITGGLGSVPGTEGFGRDHELDPFYAYAETCAALACIFWNWELAKLTGKARYSDLLEWQFYNAALVGMGADGKSYLYNNPLASRGGITRRSWYAVPCCPSNLSRTIANLEGRLALEDEQGLWVHQYFGGTYQGSLAFEQHSQLPYKGQSVLHLTHSQAQEFCLHLRQPSWCSTMQVFVNGTLAAESPQETSLPSTVDPTASRWLSLERTWDPGDKIEISFEMPIRLLQAHPRVRGHKGKVTLTRGPLVYCLESIDNPGIDLFNVKLDRSSLQVQESPLFGGIHTITGMSTTGEPLIFIPYHLWANRGESQMTVWVRT